MGVGAEESDGRVGTGDADAWMRTVGFGSRMRMEDSDPEEERRTKIEGRKLIKANTYYQSLIFNQLNQSLIHNLYSFFMIDLIND